MQRFGYRDWSAGVRRYEQWRRGRKWWWLVAGVVFIMAGVALWAALTQ
jgi:hypothetical protein